MLRLGLSTATLWFVVDQATKWWILNYVMDPPRVIPITGFFNLVLGRNTGVTFGLFGNASPWMLTALALTIMAGLIVWMKSVKDKMTVLGLGLVIGGAVGNVVDRLRHGGVTDFLDFYVAQWHWPTFNMADVGIFCGVALLLWESFRSGKQAEPSAT